ncbi:STAS domain-containing protein [Kitasatospora sp. NPDC056181]|uniref:STAS domain-containing protein n=1 Tax=Kitasatospora sp. NPDC056181 TaxID=3345737 RepID=UPI0035D6ECFA
MDTDWAQVGLTVVVRASGRSVIVRPEGELDNDTAEPLYEALNTVLRGPPGPVVVDCDGLSFCDSTGLNLLLRARRSAEGDGRTLLLAGLSPTVSRLFEITGAGTMFRIYPSLADALAGQDG